MAPLSTRSADMATPFMEIGDCSISSPLAFSRPINSPCTRLATRLGFFAAVAASSNWSASERVLVSVAASYSVMPYCATRRARRASGSSGNSAIICVAPFFIDDKRKQIGLRKISIIVRLLFRPHAIGPAFGGVVQARLLLDPAAGLQHLLVALDLILQRLPDEAEGVDVLDFGLGAEFLLPARADADVGVAAQRAFFHVAVADAGVEDDLLQPRQVFPGLIGRGDVGLADDLDQRHAGAVQIDRGPLAAVGQAVVQALARVFFEMHARDADALKAARVS